MWTITNTNSYSPHNLHHWFLRTQFSPKSTPAKVQEVSGRHQTIKLVFRCIPNVALNHVHYCHPKKVVKFSLLLTYYPPSCPKQRNQAIHPTSWPHPHPFYPSLSPLQFRSGSSCTVCALIPLLLLLANSQKLSLFLHLSRPYIYLPQLASLSCSLF